MRCDSCKQPITSPAIIGGMEIELCENCKPRPTALPNPKGAAYDDYDYEDA